MDNNLLDRHHTDSDRVCRARSSRLRFWKCKGRYRRRSSYRWRIVSNRYKEVTVVASTKKSLFGKPALSGFDVYGLGETKTLKPNLKDLQDFLGKAELTAVR